MYRGKVRLILDAPVLASKTEVKEFLRLAPYYRRFIEGFAEKAGLLHEVEGPQGDFVWGSDQEEEFEELKEAVTTAPVFAQPKLWRTFIMHTDASPSAVWAIQSQEGEGGSVHLVQYAGCRLQSTEQR